ncbi:MAG: amidinotransferase [Myxococcales bacterium]|nr:hypothetical protein [Myxococcales bacterium]MCB9751565.1 amidinotransferase [Myxococcales bacterium]
MIILRADELSRATAQLPPPDPDARATMAAALVVHPRDFSISREAVDNRYKRLVEVDRGRALAQHHALVDTLGACGLPVLVFPGYAGLVDAVFPNNAFATRPGHLIVGAMRHEDRRGETARADLRGFFREVEGRRVIDLSARGVVAELTGPLIIDHRRAIGFCGMTQRVDAAGCEAMLEAFALRFIYRFDLRPSEYHTNVVMSVLAGRALVIHPGSFVDAEAPAAIMALYPGRALVLSDEEKRGFVGNCLAITEHDLLLSATAWRTLRPASRATLQSWGFTPRIVDVSEFEKAGGSVRCMTCEIF